MSHDRVRVYVPDGNTNAAEIEINGERPAISRLEVLLEPDALPTVKVELCPQELDFTIEAEPVYSLADFTTDANQVSGKLSTKFDSPELYEVHKATAKIASRALVDSMFERIEAQGGRSFVDNLQLFTLKLGDAKGYDPYNRCPA